MSAHTLYTEEVALQRARQELARAQARMLSLTGRGDLLLKLGRRDEARREFDRAATPTRNTRERALLLARLKEQLS